MQQDRIGLTFFIAPTAMHVFFLQKCHFNFTPQMYEKVLYSQQLY